MFASTSFVGHQYTMEKIVLLLTKEREPPSTVIPVIKEVLCIILMSIADLNFCFSKTKTL